VIAQRERHQERQRQGRRLHRFRELEQRIRAKRRGNRRQQHCGSPFDVPPTQPPGERSRCRRREADREPRDEQEQGLRASRPTRGFNAWGQPRRRHLQQARRHAEPRDGVAVGTLSMVKSRPRA
jgi:hypothetical protein